MFIKVKYDLLLFAIFNFVANSFPAKSARMMNDEFCKFLFYVICELRMNNELWCDQIMRDSWWFASCDFV